MAAVLCAITVAAYLHYVTIVIFQVRGLFCVLSVIPLPSHTLLDNRPSS